MNIGTDILYIPRLKKIITTYPSFIKKVYTKKEVIQASRYKDPLLFYATRFASKEAIIKATNGKYDFSEIEILKSSDGKPIDKIINNDNINIELSISYDNDYVIAFCITTMPNESSIPSHIEG